MDTRAAGGAGRQAVLPRWTLGKKIGGLAAALLVLLIAVAAYSYLQLQGIRLEVAALTRADIPIREAIRSVQVNRLEQQIALERVLRLSFQGETQVWADRQIEASHRFDQASQKVRDSAMEGKRIAQQADSAGRPGYRDFDQIFDRLLQDHQRFEERGEALIDLAVLGNTGEAQALVDDVNEITRQLDARVAELYSQLERFTEQSNLDATIRQQSALRASMLLGIIAILVGTLVAFFIVRRLTGSVGKVTDRARQIVQGIEQDDLTYRPLVVPSSDEIGYMAAVLDQMLQTLVRNTAKRKEAEAELRKLNASLEEKVAERSAAAKQRAEALARSEEALRRQSNLLRSILDSIGDGVLVVDENRRVLVFNPAARQILGFGQGDASYESLRDRLLYTLIPDSVSAGRSAVPSPMIQALRGETFDQEEALLRPPERPDGIWISVTGRPLRDENGVVHGGVCVFRDVTGRKRAEEALAAYAARLEQSNQEWQELTYASSHDLQEPLRKIQLLGDRLKAKYMDALDETGRDYMERLHAAASRMQALIGDLLTYANVTIKAQPFGPVNLEEVAKEVVAGLEPSYQEAGGRLEVGALPTIEADPLQMYQLFWNLVENALKFQREDVPPVVRIHGRLIGGGDGGRELPSGGACELYVEDNGIGFEEKYLDRIFRPFEQLHGKEEYDGTGMGLAICRKIVSRHGGTITARSSPEGGATFVITLPLKPLQQTVPRVEALAQ